MQIDKDMADPGADEYYTKAFRDTLEAHMTYFRESSKTRTIDVEPNRAVVYEGDLFGYLAERGIPMKEHWITMRVNKMFSPYEFGLATTMLLIVDSGDITSIQQSARSGGSIAV